uniref:Peptidase M13 C-terminal domain-containing protein n=1 Tax=Ciona savignyi TaxID=51511 RepID=H2ZJ06_CIOSA
MCLTESCLKTAAKILSRMDQSVNPCQDFYTYSCGGWLSKNYISPNKIEYSMASKMRERNDRIIYELLIKPTAQANGQRNTNLSQAEEKARKFYHSCIDLEQIEALGSRPLIDLIVSLGGWAARGDDSRWNFNELIYQNQGVLSNSVFFSISVEMDPTNASQHIVMVDQEGSLTLPDRMFYFYDYQVHSFKIILELLDEYNGNYLNPLDGGMNFPCQRELSLSITPMDHLLAINRSARPYGKSKCITLTHRTNYRLLDKIPLSTLNAGKNNDVFQQSIDELLHEPVTRRKSKLLFIVEWFRFLQRIFIRKQISLDTEILVIGPQYFFSNLSRLIQNSTRETLENYMMWRTVFSQSSRLSLSFRRAAASLTYDIYGIKDVIPRWKECLGYVKQQFSAAIGLMFVKETFSSAMKKDVFKVVQFIKESFRRNLDSIQWLDRTSKKALSKRLDAISVKIGYDSKYRDMPDLLDTLYSFPVEPFTFFKNYKNSVQGKVNLSAAKLVSPVDNTEWLLPFDYTNAYFSQKRKQMIFPAGFLQQPFYDPAAPSVVNFGAVGSTIGHELVHGFDDIGMRYNNDGSIKDWWSMALFMNYSKRADCVTQTYNRYNSLLTFQLLGVSTQKENIADMAGVKLSYQAYRAWVQNQPRYSIARRVLPGLSLSNEQIFFVSFAQAWCKKRVASFQPSYTGAHAPERYRVIGSLSQFQSFSDVFSCKPGSPMNPVQKCTVW